MFYENGQQYFSPNSSVGKNCLEKIKQQQQEKYIISVNNDSYRNLLLSMNKIAVGDVNLIHMNSMLGLIFYLLKIMMDKQ